MFDDTRTVEMSMGNRIILAGRDGLPPAETLRERTTRQQMKLLAVGIFAAEVESQAQPKISGYRPLTDQYSPANLLFGE